MMANGAGKRNNTLSFFLHLFI